MPAGLTPKSQLKSRKKQPDHNQRTLFDCNFTRTSNSTPKSLSQLPQPSTSSFSLPRPSNEPEKTTTSIEWNSQKFADQMKKCMQLEEEESDDHVFRESAYLKQKFSEQQASEQNVFEPMDCDDFWENASTLDALSLNENNQLQQSQRTNDTKSEEDDFGLNRTPHCSSCLSELKASKVNIVFYNLPLSRDSLPVPFPIDRFDDKWHSLDFIKMPFSPLNQVYQTDNSGKKTKVEKWKIISRNLTYEPITTSSRLVKAIKIYNPTMASQSFNVLKQLIDQSMNPSERTEFFEILLPQMISLTLQLPDLIHRSIPVLKQRTNRSLFFTQQQVSSLLANAFFCTFPKRNHYANLPEINFKGLFSEPEDLYFNRKLEKLKCVINYFRRILRDIPKGVVSFERRCLVRSDIPNWLSDNRKLRKMVVRSKGFIEKEGSGMLQVDFANKFVGGGVLGAGLVQEEIRFMTNPELILSRLFTEKLLDNEVLFIVGTEQFNNYSGYSDTFRWTGDFIDRTPFDEWGRRHTRIVAMDASYFSACDMRSQYCKKLVDRELTKAYCAFMERDILDADKKSAIASGNWGCGAYGGDPHLKSLIQLIAASHCERDLLYITFGDDQLAKDLDEFGDNLTLNDTKSGQLYQYLIDFGDYIMSLPQDQEMEPLFKYITRKHLK